METKPTRKPRNIGNKPNVQHIPTNSVENDALNEKVSQIISLQNGLSANEKMLDILNEKIKEYSKQVIELKEDNVRVRTLHNNLDYNLKHAYEQLAKLPSFVKWIYKIH